MARKAAGTKAEASKPATTRWLLGLVCAALAVLAAPIALLLIGLLAPAGIALLAERRQGARPLLLLGLACSVQPLIEFWHANAGQGAAVSWQGGLFRIGLLQINSASDAAMQGLADNIATAWIVQAAGWLFLQAAPLLIGIVIDAMAMKRVDRLRQARADCLAQWDMDEK